jgi:hypothetical protein
LLPVLVVAKEKEKENEREEGKKLKEKKKNNDGPLDKNKIFFQSCFFVFFFTPCLCS